jgi:hypothetical protein
MTTLIKKDRDTYLRARDRVQTDRLYVLDLKEQTRCKSSPERCDQRTAQHRHLAPLDREELVQHPDELPFHGPPPVSPVDVPDPQPSPTRSKETEDGSDQEPVRRDDEPERRSIGLRDVADHVSPALLDHPPDLGECGPEIDGIPYRETGQDQIERAGPEGHVLEDSPDDVEPLRFDPPLRERGHHVQRFHGDHVYPPPPPEREVREGAGTAPRIEGPSVDVATNETECSLTQPHVEAERDEPVDPVIGSADLRERLLDPSPISSETRHPVKKRCAAIM